MRVADERHPRTKDGDPVRRAALLLLVVGLAVAGCGSGGKSPSVASLGGNATTTTTSSSQSATPPSGGFSTGGGGGGASFQMKIRGGVKYAQCMRAHGVHNFPDPDSTGGISITSASGLNPNSPTFRAAQAACRKELPNGGRPTPEQIAKVKKAALAFSACMRAHGVHNFPDPTFTGGGVSMRMHSGPGSDLNKDNPTFQRAQSACGGLLTKVKG
jgi:hypothetical protein